jgi:predicted metal-dependent hydrolase
MSTEPHAIVISGITVQVIRKDIKNLHLGVYPPEGRVRVAAPVSLSDDAVRLAVISRLSWIKKQQAQFAGQERQSAREYVSGESHYYQGNRYLLNVVYHDGPSAVIIRDKTTLDLIVRVGSDTARRERVLLDWYRVQLKEMVPPLVVKWEAVMGVEVAEWGVKHMKTLWGACNPDARRIWLNLELVKKPVGCVEYIVVHEMVHLLERRHNTRFVALMDEFLPQWRLHREVLNAAPLGHAEWEY